MWNKEMVSMLEPIYVNFKTKSLCIKQTFFLLSMLKTSQASWV